MFASNKHPKFDQLFSCSNTNQGYQRHCLQYPGSAYEYPLINLLFQKVQFWAASRISALPPHHLLHVLTCKSTSCFVRKCRSLLHYLFFILHNWDQTMPNRNHHPCQTSSNVPPHNADLHQLWSRWSLQLCQAHPQQHQIQSLYRWFRIWRGDRCHSSTKTRSSNHYNFTLALITKHTIYESELIGLFTSSPHWHAVSLIQLL